MPIYRYFEPISKVILAKYNSKLTLISRTKNNIITIFYIHFIEVIVAMLFFFKLKNLMNYPIDDNFKQGV